MVEPRIVVDDVSGRNNSPERLKQFESQGVYKDCSTICIIPTLGKIPARVVQTWFNIITPPNQKFLRMWVIGMEVGAAYTTAIEQILAHDDLKNWKYVLMLEEDNSPPPDGLLKLVESIEGGVDGKKYDVMGGLYWTKGEGGVPQIWGNPGEMPKTFVPQPPRPDQIVQCNGTGMGFTLMRLSMFKDKKLRKPWFKTQASFELNKGSQCFTQDLWFAHDAGQFGYKFAVDCRVKVGHFDYNSDLFW